MKRIRIAVLALAAAGALAALVLIPVSRSIAQGGGPFDDVANHYSCYNITDHEGFVPTDARLVDQFGLSVADVLEPVLLCNPVSKNQGEVPEPDWHLVCYDLLVDQDPGEEPQAGAHLRHALLRRRPAGAERHHVAGDGPIPVMRIDDLGLTACDLICLDVEGYELMALAGAIDTIRRYRPVVMVEDKGCSRRYGVEEGAVESWLVGAFEYRLAERVNRDVVLAP